MPTTPRADGVCETSRQLPFKAGDVFNAMAQADQLAQWWGPEGFTNEFELFEFRPQGRWRFTMVGPDGQRYPNENHFLETSPTRVVVRHLEVHPFTLTITLNDQGGHTEVRWRQAFDDPALAASIWHIIEPANEQNLDRLHALLAQRAAQ